MTLHAENVAFSYSRNKAVLESVSADVVPGSFLAILGVNGSGKSTFLDCLDAMLRPNHGTVLLNGSNVQGLERVERAQSIAYVAQHSHANRVTVYDALLLGRKPFIRTVPTKDDYAVVDRIVADMNLQDLALRYTDELSGGEYQKIMIARAFVQTTDVLLLDEPTNNLDMANQTEVMRLVRQAVDQRGIAAAAVMHDVNLALAYCDRFLVLRAGRVEAYGGADIITEELISRVYGVEADIIEHQGRRVVIPR